MRRTTRRAGVRVAGVLIGAGMIVAVTALPALAAHTVSGYFPTTVAASSAGNSCYVTIQGTGFSGTPTVTFNGPPAVASTSVLVDSSTRITALVPTTATAGAQSVTVTIGADVVTGPATLTIAGSGGCPTVTSMTPSSGAVGTTVTITGTNFNTNAATMFVRFGSTDVLASNVTLSTLQATVPAGVTGSVPVRVTNTAVNGALNPGSGLSPINFTVSTAAPTITSFSPTSGPVGTSVIITGTGFTGATSVKFNNVSASFVVNSDTQITATVPTGATTGKITVTTASGTGTSSTNFTVTGVSHPRTASFQLSGHLRGSGTVSVNDGFTDCSKFVPVKLQRQGAGGNWKTLELLSTNANGGFSGFLPNQSGKYRAKVSQLTLLTGAVCGGDASPVRNYVRS